MRLPKILSRLFGQPSQSAQQYAPEPVVSDALEAVREGERGAEARVAPEAAPTPKTVSHPATKPAAKRRPKVKPLRRTKTTLRSGGVDRNGLPYRPLPVLLNPDRLGDMVELVEFLHHGGHAEAGEWVWDQVYDRNPAKVEVSGG